MLESIASRWSISVWNNLCTDCVPASVNVFKNRVDKSFVRVC